MVNIEAVVRTYSERCLRALASHTVVPMMIVMQD
jgi:hypothetical protein